MNKPGHFLNRAVWLVALVSLFTDMAGEMLYPVMPLFFQQMGYSGVWAGVMESIADALAGISKPYFGRLSDKRLQRKPFIQWGYGLSALAKPAMAIWPVLPWFMFWRSADRLGKGMRTGARDALLTEVSLPEYRGRVFGFHRAMDTLGALIGPLFAFAYLYFFPEGVRSLFLWAFIPGALAVFITFLLKEAPQKVVKIPVEKLSWLAFWRECPKAYKHAMWIFGLIACVNSSDMFLLLRAAEMHNDSKIILQLYLLYNALYAIMAYPLGSLSDKLGIKPVLVVGFLMLAFVYGALAETRTREELFILFGVYGLYAAATEGLAKAWVSEHCLPAYKAQSLGLLSGLQSMGVLISGALYALLAIYEHASWAYYITAIVVIVLVVVWVLIPNKLNHKPLVV